MSTKVAPCRSASDRHRPGQDPDDTRAIETKRTALELLLAQSGRENFSEVQWLESEIADTDDDGS